MPGSSSAASAASAASSAPRIAKRRPSPVIGSTKPAASPARSRPGTPAARASTASGPRIAGAVTRRAPAGTRAEHGVRGDVPLEEPGGIREALARRRDQADVGQAGVADRRDADVVRPAHVHLPHRVEPGDALEVGADGPAARRRRMAGEPEGEGERGSAAVGGDRHVRRHADARRGGPAGPAQDGAAHRRPSTAVVHERAVHADAVLELGAGGNRGVDEQLIEHTPGQGAGEEAGPVGAAHVDAAVAGDQHALERTRHRLDARAQPGAVEQAQGAGVQRVAAQLVARKAGAIDEQDAGAGARESDGGDRSRPVRPPRSGRRP